MRSPKVFGEEPRVGTDTPQHYKAQHYRCLAVISILSPLAMKAWTSLFRGHVTIRRGFFGEKRSRDRVRYYGHG